MGCMVVKWLALSPHGGNVLVQIHLDSLCGVSMFSWTMGLWTPTINQHDSEVHLQLNCSEVCVVLQQTSDLFRINPAFTQ